MEENTIKFGTDGWRGVIADSFTFEGVRIVTQGVSNYLRKKVKKDLKPCVVIGYDTRFLLPVSRQKSLLVMISEFIFPTGLLLRRFFLMLFLKKRLIWVL